MNLDRSNGMYDVPLAVAYMQGHERLAQFLEDRGASAPDVILSIARKYRATNEETDRLTLEIPREASDIERERLSYEITVRALLFAQRHEANPYRRMFETMYLERALLRDYDPQADGTVTGFLGQVIVESLRTSRHKVNLHATAASSSASVDVYRRTGSRQRGHVMRVPDRKYVEQFHEPVRRSPDLYGRTEVQHQHEHLRLPIRTELEHVAEPLLDSTELHRRTGILRGHELL